MVQRNYETVSEQEAYAKTKSSVWNNSYIDNESIHAVFAAVVDRAMELTPKPTPRELHDALDRALAAHGFIHVRGAHGG